MTQINDSDIKLQIKIIGDNFMQNDLLSTFIENQTGFRCTQHTGIDLPSKNIDGKNIDGVNGNIMFLIDSKSKEFFNLWDKLESKRDLVSSGYYITVFNLDYDPQIGLEAIEKGVQGIFYYNEPIEIIPKGIKAILDGDLWFSRKTVSKYLMSKVETEDLPGDVNVSLTKREKEILFKLFSGQSNTEIADYFGISYNTAKTHIFNIYKKINVSNRFQATLWAAKYL